MLEEPKTVAEAVEIVDSTIDLITYTVPLNSDEDIRIRSFAEVITRLIEDKSELANIVHAFRTMAQYAALIGYNHGRSAVVNDIRNEEEYRDICKMVLF
jgi:hypothetical protein